jgi:hypothetical protein
MAVKERGEIIEVAFQLPDSRGVVKTMEHPAIIISNEEVYHQDGCYICVMKSHTEQRDSFTFELKDNMFIKPLDGTFQQARLHLVTYVFDEHITKNSSIYNKMKPNSVDRLVEHINTKSLSRLDD